MSEEKKEKKKMALWKKIAIVVVSLAIIAAIFGKSDDKSTSSSSSSKSSTAKSITIPSDQQKFIDVVESFYKPYRDAGDNQLKKSRERKNRKKKLKETMKSMSFKNWIGKIDTLGTTDDGHGYIDLDLYKSDFSIQTHNNAFSDMTSNTLIKDGTKLYDQMIELKEGDRVTVSGSFISADKDHILEISMSEDGAMTDPEFIIKISSISKYVKK